ncbi:MAG: tetratricopeptide repeat protein [Burkholderiaceae bacterium]
MRTRFFSRCCKKKPALEWALAARRELSAACLAAQDPHTAVAWLADACRMAPQQPGLWLQLGQLLAQQVSEAEAAAALRQGLQSNPDAALLLQAVAEQEMQRQDYAAALPHYQRLNHLLPGSTSVLLNFGFCQEHCLQLEAAVSTYRHALEINPDFMEAHVDLAGLLWRLEDFAGSLAHAQRAAALAPGHPYAVRILGTVLFQLGRLEEAQKYLEQALQLQPDFAIAQIDLAMLQLLAGDMAAGWRTYQKRWNDTTRMTRPDFFRLENEWQGLQQQPLLGKRILVYAEQGFGDVIQFIRYAACLQAEGAQVFCQAPLELVPLLSRMPGLTCLMPAQLLHTHYHVALLDLPLHFESLLPPAPYLSVSDDAQAIWQERLAAWPGKMKIGIAWAGNPAHANHHNRSLYLSDFCGLMALEGVQCFSLQKSVGGRYTDCAPSAAELVDLTPQWQDFEASAAMVSALELVICADSAVAHLAGALGKPVWLLLPPNPDWRWLQHREDSPWYPSMRLFRRAHGQSRADQMQQVLRVLAEHPNPGRLAQA